MSKDQKDESIETGNLILPDEKALLLNHNYDGIEELNNPLPKWWQVIFYATIIFSAIYVGYYEFGDGPSLDDDLNRDMAGWNALKAQTSGAPSGESMDALLNDPNKKVAILEQGKAVLAVQCLACHGPEGQGVVGPNLTDRFWIHGTGRTEDIYKVIAEGVAEKGMPPWGNVLKPDELIASTIYVASLNGTNPPNPKEPQGTEVKR